MIYDVEMTSRETGHCCHVYIEVDDAHQAAKLAEQYFPELELTGNTVPDRPTRGTYVPVKVPSDVMHDGVVCHSAERITDTLKRSQITFCSRCGDWFKPAIRPERRKRKLTDSEVSNYMKQP